MQCKGKPVNLKERNKLEKLRTTVKTVGYMIRETLRNSSGGIMGHADLHYWLV